MGFDDLFGNEHNHHKRGHNHNHNYDHNQSFNRGQNFGHDKNDDHDDHFPSAQSYYNKNDLKQQLLIRLQNDPKFKSYLIIGVVLILLMVLIAVIALFPLLIKLLNYFTQNGIQGIIDTLWKGTN
jgi:hypothetical protein